jgi:hypothetical protein
MCKKLMFLIVSVYMHAYSMSTCTDYARDFYYQSDAHAAILKGSFACGFISGFICGDEKRPDIYLALPIGVNSIGLHHIKQTLQKTGFSTNKDIRYTDVCIATSIGALCGLGTRKIYDFTLKTLWTVTHKTYNTSKYFVFSVIKPRATHTEEPQ